MLLGGHASLSVIGLYVAVAASAAMLAASAEGAGNTPRYLPSNA